MKLSASDLHSLVYQHLKDLGYAKVAKRFATSVGQDLEKQEPFTNIGLLRIVKIFIKNSPEGKKDFKAWKKVKTTDKKEESEEEEVEEKAPVLKKRKASDLSNGKSEKESGKNKKAKKEETESENEEEKPKNSPKHDDENANYEEEEEVNDEDLTNNYFEHVVNKTHEANAPRKTFSRIKEGAGNDLKAELKDNTFEAKKKFGQGGDDWGIASHERLKDKKGKNFKKEKTKMKNKNFHGQGVKIEYKVNSIRL